MDNKLKLAWKKFFEEKLSKEKYIGNETLAAQKALAKVKEMREARMFNITLYRYKGAVKGIKVVPKNPNTPNVASKKKEVKEEPIEEVKEEVKEEMKEEPVPTPEPVKKEDVQKEEPVKETKPEEDLMKNPEFMKMFMQYLIKDIPNEQMEEEEVPEEDIPEEEVIEVKPVKKTIPAKRAVAPKKEKLPPPPKPVKLVPPKRAKRIPMMEQKYIMSNNFLSNPITPQTTKKDFARDKDARIKAFSKLYDL